MTKRSLKSMTDSEFREVLEAKARETTQGNADPEKFLEFFLNEFETGDDDHRFIEILTIAIVLAKSKNRPGSTFVITAVPPAA